MTKLVKNVVIAALARDCSDALEKNIPRIEELRKRFRWSHVVIVENDSVDNTKFVLKEWQNKHERVTVISKDYGTLTIPEKSDEVQSPTTSYYRIKKMSFYRNIYLSFIDKLDKDIDYVIVIDVDIDWFCIDGILNSIIKSPSDWGAIFANGITKKTFFGISSEIYFDTFAVYEYPIKSNFYYSQKSLDSTFKTSNKNVKKYNFYSVISAFSGIGIYRYNAIKGLRYKAILNLSNSNEGICEHIPFNEELIKLGYKNYVSKNLVVIYGTHKIGLFLKLIMPARIFNLIRNFSYK
jgi:hypothetical protein